MDILYPAKKNVKEEQELQDVTKDTTANNMKRKRHGKSNRQTKWLLDLRERRKMAAKVVLENVTFVSTPRLENGDVKQMKGEKRMSAKMEEKEQARITIKKEQDRLDHFLKIISCQVAVPGELPVRMEEDDLSWSEVDQKASEEPLKTSAGEQLGQTTVTDHRSPDSDIDDREDSVTDPMELVMEVDLKKSIPSKELKRQIRSTKGGKGGRTPPDLKLSSKSKNVQKTKKLLPIGAKTRERNLKMFQRWAATGRLSEGGGKQPE